MCNSSQQRTINRRAPPQILGVLPGQPVELRVAKRVAENYSPPPKRPLAAFGGSGNRLGSPAPAFAPDGSNAPAAVMPGSFPSAGGVAGTSAGASAERSSVNTLFEVDQSLPTTSVQIRLADGTRYSSFYCLRFFIHSLIHFQDGL